MLQAGVIRPFGAVVAAAAVLLSACGDGGPIEENVVRPGITAMEQASGLACSSDAQVLGQAIQIYTELEGEPPPDEAALIAAGFLRDESTLHDVVDGQVVPMAVDCGGTGAPAPTVPPGSAPMTAPSTDFGEIVTSTEPPLTPAQMLSQFTAEEIAEVGGEACAGELASLFVAAQNYFAEQGKDPASVEELTAYLDQPIELWMVQEGSLTAAPGSGCVALDAAPADQAAACRAEAATLTVAREAYFAVTPGAAEPTQADLVAAGLLREQFTDLDLVEGAVVAVPGGPCEGADLAL